MANNDTKKLTTGKLLPVAALGAAMVGVGVYLLAKRGAAGGGEEGEWVDEDEQNGQKVLASQPFSVIISGGNGGPGLTPPAVQTLEAVDITQNTVTLQGRLLETGFWSQVYVFFDIDGEKTKKVRMYEGDEGGLFTAEVTGLKAGTSYRFRAGVDAIGDRSDEMPTQYGDYKTFNTPEAELLEVYKTRYYHSTAGRSEGHYYDEPQAADIGDWIGAQFNFRNTSGRTLNVEARLVIYSPLHSAGRAATMWEGTMVADKVRAVHLWDQLDDAGNWTINLRLNADGEEVINITIPIMR